MLDEQLPVDWCQHCTGNWKGAQAGFAPESPSTQMKPPSSSLEMLIWEPKFCSHHPLGHLSVLGAEDAKLSFLFLWLGLENAKLRSVRHQL